MSIAHFRCSDCQTKQLLLSSYTPKLLGFFALGFFGLFALFLFANTFSSDTVEPKTKSNPHELIKSKELNKPKLTPETSLDNRDSVAQEVKPKSVDQQTADSSLLELPSLEEPPKAPKEAQSDSPSYQGREAILALNPLYHTIQIASAESKSEAEEVIDILKDNGFTQPLFYYRSPRQDETWYPVLSGYYKSNAEAANARSQLPDWIKQKKPFVRQLANVQAKIKQYE